jgi:xanthine dehydrogenase accessory factor
VESNIAIVLVRGAGDLGSGAILRLRRAGIQVLVTELAQPLAVRRLVCISEAVYAGEVTVEDVTARLVPDVVAALPLFKRGIVPVIIDPFGETIDRLSREFKPFILVDARMTKAPGAYSLDTADYLIGFGPGFIAGVNCHAAIETNRGPDLGRVIWQGTPQPDTGVPDHLPGRYAYPGEQRQRVLRAPKDGTLLAKAAIGEKVTAGQTIATVDGEDVIAPFSGFLRGLFPEGIPVLAGMKIGDIDPRDDPMICRRVSDKALAVGGGVLEAILSRPEIRRRLWSCNEAG